MPPAPDADLLARFAVEDSARVAWWRERLRAVQELL
jgi:O-succinylbenzoate synthase